MPANDAGDYKTVRVLNKESGQYFDVKVPYRSTLSPEGTISKEEPSPNEIERAVDKARWDAELKSSIDNFTRPHASSGIGDSHAPVAGTTSTPSGASPFDQTTSAGSSYHDAESPFDAPQPGGSP